MTEQGMLRLFKRSRENAAIARAVYGTIVAQARQPALYADFGVADTVDGRFDMVVLHLVLAMERLRRAGAAGGGLAQAVFDAFLTDMDRTLRESGVGDLSVPRKMKTLGESFYGRWQAYIEPLQSGDRQRLVEAVGRNVFPGVADPDGAGRLADYALRVRTGLDGIGDASLIAGQLTFPDVATADGVAS